MPKKMGGGVLLAGVRVGWISEVSNSNRGVESRGGVRVDVNEEAKCLWKFKKKLGGGGCGVWVDVTKELKL